jgi:hypothetical protein
MEKPEPEEDLDDNYMPPRGVHLREFLEINRGARGRR